MPRFSHDDLPFDIAVVKSASTGRYSWGTITDGKCNCSAASRGLGCPHLSSPLVSLDRGWGRFCQAVSENFDIPGEFEPDIRRLGELLKQHSIPEAMAKLRKKSGSLKPPAMPDESEFVVTHDQWALLSYGLAQRVNTLLIGPAQCGKTRLVRLWGRQADRPVFHFNVGGWFNPSSQLVGNVHYTPETGTVFRESDFVKAVQTPNAVILLDEFTRAEYHVQNALMNCLDGVRELRLDGHPDCPVIPFAEGVSLAAAANVGNDYKGTQVLDAAVLERFPVVLHMDYMDKDQEARFLLRREYRTGSLCPIECGKLTEFAEAVRRAKRDNELKMNFSTARVIEIAEYLAATETEFKDAFHMLIKPAAQVTRDTEKVQAIYTGVAT